MKGIVYVLRFKVCCQSFLHICHENGEEDDEEVNVPRVVTMKGKRSKQAIAIDSRTDKMFIM